MTTAILQAVQSASQEIHVFYGVRRSFVFTRTRHWFLY